MENYSTTQLPEDARTLETSYTEELGEAHELTMRQQLIRRIGAPLAGVATLLGASTVEAPAAHADSSLEYTVTNTEGGVFSRNSPRTNDTPRIVGQGAYDGDRVRLICGVTNGEAVGPYDNNSWHKVINLSRPNQGEFWMSDRYVTSPNKADELAPGEPNCNEPNADFSDNAPDSNPPTTHRVGNCKSDGGAAVLDGMGRILGGLGSIGTQSSTQLVCIKGEFSSVDEYNHRQFIGKVEGSAPNIQPGGCTDALKLEVWGEGFYKESNCTVENWDINTWLPNGSSVCAAISSARDTASYPRLQEAEEAVRSGQIQLGEKAQKRDIICIDIKA